MYVSTLTDNEKDNCRRQKTNLDNEAINSIIHTL